MQHFMPWILGDAGARPANLDPARSQGEQRAEENDPGEKDERGPGNRGAHDSALAHAATLGQALAATLRHVDRVRLAPRRRRAPAPRRASLNDLGDDGLPAAVSALRSEVWLSEAVRVRGREAGGSALAEARDSGNGGLLARAGL